MSLASWIAVTLASQEWGKNLRIFLTNSSVLKDFPKDFNSFVIWVKRVYISITVSQSLISNSSYFLICSSMHDCLTWFVPSWATWRASHMFLADWHSEMQVYSSRPRPKYKSFLALAFFYIILKSSALNSSGFLWTLLPSSITFLGMSGPFLISIHNS